MTVVQAIRKAERILPGQVAPEGQMDPRWQAIMLVEEHIEEHPDEVWRFARKWGTHANADLRTAIATLLVEHLLEYHFSRIFPLVSGACRQSARFADTVNRCWALGQAKKPANMRRLRALLNEVSDPAANTPLQQTCRSRSGRRRNRKSAAAPARR